MKALVSLFLFLALGAGAGEGVRAQELDLFRSRPGAKEKVTFQHNLNFEFLKPRKQGKVPLADRPFYSLSWSDWKQTIRELDQEAEGTEIRFREVAHPIILERNNVFYQRDLTALVNLKRLRSLFLTDTPVSDLTPLANLKSLQVLDLKNTQVSKEQITKLQQALPNCEILK